MNPFTDDLTLDPKMALHAEKLMKLIWFNLTPEPLNFYSIPVESYDSGEVFIKDRALSLPLHRR